MADENKRYIKINKFSQNNYKDRADPTGDNGEFNKIKNYIPSPRKIETRKGVSEYSYSQPYDIIRDPDLLMHLKMDGGQAGFRDCEVQGDQYMRVTAGGSISPSTTHKVVGSSSLKLDYANIPGAGLGLFYFKHNSTLPATFPGQGGTDFILGFWTRIEKQCSGVYIMRHDNTGTIGGWGISVHNNTPPLDVYAHITDCGTGRNQLSSKQLVLNQWYHIGLWSSTALDKFGIVIYSQTDNDTTDDTKSGYHLDGVASTSGHFWCGMDRKNALTYTDDLILLDAVPATEAAILAKITLMRARGL